MTSTLRSRPLKVRTRWALFALLMGVAVCTDGTSPTAPVEGMLQMGIVPRLAEGQFANGAAAVSRIRITAVMEATGDTLSQVVEDVDPNQESWTLVVGVPVPSEATRPIFYIVLELMSVVGGAEVVEWSGQSRPLPLDLTAIPEIRSVPVVRGPVDNLTVTAVDILEHPATVLEGDTVRLAASVTSNDEASSPVLFWNTLDSAVARVS